MNKNIERQVKYNSSRSTQNSERMEWFFLIINQQREICNISNRIYDLFAPIEEEGRNFEGIITGTGLRYKMLNFESRKKVEKSEFKRIYVKLILDRKLNNRESSDGLENYVINKLEG